MIDQDRYRRFRRELQALVDDLSPEELVRTLEAKLIDAFAREQLRPDDPRIERLLRALFQDDVVEPYAERLIQAYADTVALVNDLYTDLGVDVTRDAARVRAIEQVNQHDLGNYAAASVERIRRTVRQSLIAGDTVNELARRLRPVSRKVAAYSRTLAQTQVKAYGRTLKAEKAARAQVVYYEYVGIIRATTRPFCRALVGTTHHVNTIRRMDNGNRNPVMIFAGGWNCIHDWEPDPFATRTDAAPDETFTLSDGNQVLTLAGSFEDVRKRFDAAITERAWAALNDPQAFIERVRQVQLAPKRRAHILQQHPDLSKVDQLVQQIRSRPDRLYYQFHRGASTVVFERNGHFLFVTEREVKTLFAPDDYATYVQKVASFWKRID